MSEKKYPILSAFLKRKLKRSEILAVLYLVMESFLKKWEICRFSEDISKTIKDLKKTLPIKTDYKCPICTSPHRSQYELYYLSSDKDLEWVLSAAYSLNEHHITLKDLKKHFQNHFNPQADISKASQKTLKIIAAWEGPDFVENVLSHFTFTHELLEKLEKRIKEIIDEKREIPSKDADLLKSLLLTLLRYASWLRDFKGKEEEEVCKLEDIFPYKL
jgi:hypothetical protein